MALLLVNIHGIVFNNYLTYMALFFNNYYQLVKITYIIIHIIYIYIYIFMCACGVCVFVYTSYLKDLFTMPHRNKM